MKKITKRILTTVTAVSLAAVSAFSAFAVVGDIDNNNRTTTNDARLVLRYALKLGSLTEEQKSKADINSDGVINSSDARTLLRGALKLERLDIYSNFYAEIVDPNGYTSKIGICGKDILIEADVNGKSMGMLKEKNGSLIFIDNAEKKYYTLTKEDLDAIIRLAGNLGEDVDFSDIFDEFDKLTSEIELYRPIALVDLGYTKGTGEWDGKTVDTYTKTEGSETVTYYFSKNIILGVQTNENGKITTGRYNNFTSQPENIIYAFRNNYEGHEFIEMMF